MAINKTKDIVSRKDIVNIVSIILANWYWLVTLPILAYLTSYVYTHRIPEVYAAKCQILLKSNETYDYQQQIYRGLGFGSKYASYEETASQMRVIKSSNILEEVLGRIPLEVSYFIVGRLKVTEIYQHMPFRVVAEDRSSSAYGMRFSVNILDENNCRLRYEVRGVSKDMTLGFGKLVVNDGLYFRIQKSPNLNEASIENLAKINYEFEVHPKNALVSKYKAAIEVKNIPYTSIVEVSLQDEIAKRAEEVLDTLANIYVWNTVQNQSEVNENTLNYINKQLVEVTRIINDIEAELESYKEQKAVLNLTKEEDTYYKRMVDVENEIHSIEMEQSAIDDLTDYLLQNEDVQSLLPPSIFVNYEDPRLSNQVSTLYTLRTEYISLLESGTSSNPKISGLLEHIQSIKEDIMSYLDGQNRVLTQKKSELVDERARYEGKIMNIPKTQRQILNIERRLAVNEELYSFLLSKRAETVIAKAGLIPETKIIEQARSAGVVYPDKNKMNLTNAIVGLGIGILIVVLRVFFFTKITSVGQLQTVTEIPILGSVPKIKNFSTTYRISQIEGQNQVVQSFRSLRTNLQFLAPDKSCCRVLVMSLLPGEGKTFTSVNLATILAMAEKRVLVIDFDLHKPRLAKALEMENHVGVSSYLIGQVGASDIIQHTDIKTLDVITSGPVPPNASELIMRPQVDSLIETLEKSYDYIFFDSPPVSLITDGVWLMAKADVKLFVLNSKSTSKTSIDYIEQLIESKGIDGCALILNEEQVSRLNYYYNRYGYGGYGYGGYGYGSYTDSTK
ncbi:MAG: polysaccharide biosynthesis tyrosine autokinase [Flavobacteriales bacterium]